MASIDSIDSTVPPRKRRRAIILESAAALFIERGFYATGINDIGAAAGITGPGLYRHFSSKDEILMEIFNQVWQRIAPPESDAGMPADARLRQLVDSHVSLAVNEAALVQLWLTDHVHLPPQYLARTEANYARYIKTWTAALREVRPELTAGEASALCIAVVGMINASTSRLPEFKPKLHRRVIYSAAVHALHAPLDAG